MKTSHNKSISDLERLIEVRKRIEALRDEHLEVEEALLLADEERLLWQKLSQPVLMPYPVPYYPVPAYPLYPFGPPWVITTTERTDFPALRFVDRGPYTVVSTGSTSW